jgi:DNA polymerase III alpha subunit (gram-positive type)
MAVQVKLKDIIEGLEFLTDEGTSYLNTTTGEVVSITDEELRAAEEDEPLEDFPEWQHDAIRIAKDIVETDHYLPLPDRFEIHEYSIMERFCLSVDDEDIRDDLCNAIRGRGAFHQLPPAERVV